MPIYADEVPFDDLRKLERYHVCAECEALLKLSWSNDRNCYMLVCERFENHNGLRRLGRDAEIDEILNKLKGAPLPMETQALRLMNPKQMLDRVNQARFPKDLTVTDRELIAQISIEYGLDPLFGELMIYQGRPYVTIDARRRKAQETKMLDGVNSRPATKDERVARKVPAEDYLFVAQVWLKGASHPFEGWGRVTKTEIDRAIAQAKSHGKQEDALPIVKDPAAHAEKRAEAQGLRRGFHLPLPSFEEIIEGEFREVKEAKDTPPPPAPPAKGNLTQPQRQKIWGDAKKMGYSDDAVSNIIRVKFAVAGINDLSIAQASSLIEMIDRGEGVSGEEIATSKKSNPDLWKKEGEE